MSDKSRVLCKYHVSGVCRFGSECAFSHDLGDLPNQVCKYYLAGCCAYGDRCRYDHKRPDYWKAARAAAARSEQQQQQQQQQQARRPAAVANQQQQQLQQQHQAAAAGGSAAQHWTSAHGAGGGDVVAAAAATRGCPPFRESAWSDVAAPSREQLRLPRTLSGASGRRGGGDGDGGDGGVAESWEEVAAAAGGSCPAAAGDDDAAAAAAAVQADAAEADEYGEYDDCDGDGGMYDNGGQYDYGMGYGQQQQGYYYGDGGGDDGGAEEGEYDEYDDGDGGGLVIVDDDVGMERERAAVARAAARSGGRRPAEAVSLGGGGGGGGGELPSSSRWAAVQHPWEGTADDGDSTTEPVDPAEVDLCPGFALHGSCGEGEDCPLIHGLECEVCHKFWIHPYNSEAAAEHVSACRLRHERLEARLRSSGIECGICLEPVMAKASVPERRFGLLACDHAFCLACIRSWRGRTDDASLSTDTAVRTCPVCRTRSHFVTPSLVWPAGPEEKAAIVDAYKQRLAGIDCRHFDHGEGTCPFGTSCFYRHMYRDGRMEDPVLRRAGNADGDVRVVAPVRLSAFFDTPQAQRLLQGNRRR